ncbi:hypothetical protein VPMS16_1897 [Vibrio sp. 16]|nr:hypothetical protein VPMS16_1897 [Vibrio sp. 16]
MPMLTLSAKIIEFIKPDQSWYLFRVAFKFPILHLFKHPFTIVRSRL